VDAGPQAYEAPDTIRRMLVATWALLGSLAPELRRLAEHPMDDRRRLDWDFIPKPDRAGVHDRERRHGTHLRTRLESSVPEE
jgi:hypothetical protein